MVQKVEIKRNKHRDIYPFQISPHSGRFARQLFDPPTLSLILFSMYSSLFLLCIVYQSNLDESSSYNSQRFVFGIESHQVCAARVLLIYVLTRKPNNATVH